MQYYQKDFYPVLTKLEEVIMKKFVLDFMREEEGATMVEYGIMVALIAAICIAVVLLIGGKILTAFTDVNTAL